MGTCFPAQCWDSDARFAGAGNWSLAVIGAGIGSRSGGDGRDGRAGPFKDGTSVVGTVALAVTAAVSIAVFLPSTSISTRAAGGLFSSLCW